MTDTDLAQTLPDFAALTKTLGTPDATFDAWRDATTDKHWKHFDLSALRIGYELGKAAHESRAQPASVADGYRQIGWVHPVYLDQHIDAGALAIEVSQPRLSDAQVPVFVRTAAPQPPEKGEPLNNPQQLERP